MIERKERKKIYAKFQREKRVPDPLGLSPFYCFIQPNVSFSPPQTTDKGLTKPKVAL